MYRADSPILNASQDLLGFGKFAHKLSDSLLSWKDEESIVVALYGQWGSGKSSIVNLAIEKMQVSNFSDKPTVVKFNPWQFSGTDNLNQQFTQHMAIKLQLSKESPKDSVIAQKLRLYSKLLEIVPQKTEILAVVSPIAKLLGIVGLATGLLSGWLTACPSLLKALTISFSGFFLLLGFGRNLLVKLADFYDYRLKAVSKDMQELKKELGEHLKNRKRKLLIVIDDIDRLSQQEMRLIFRLIKCNTDLPNTIYLVAFDRDVVEANLEEQNGVSGKDFLEKIIQVNFDVPHVQIGRLQSVLFKGLDEILAQLPKESMRYFDREYWMNTYYSGLSSFFPSIRSIKRYLNSLEFNIALFTSKASIEVNPVDFIVIESLRVFFPEFYAFMKPRKELFTSVRTSISAYGNDQVVRDARRSEFELGLNLIGDERARNNVSKMLKKVFPPLSAVYSNTIYGGSYASTWNRMLRVCATEHFDTYFTLIPGGDEQRLTNSEVQDVLKVSTDKSKLQDVVNISLASGKIGQLLQRFQDFTDDTDWIPSQATQTIIDVLFNISDAVPIESPGFFGWGSDMDIMRITYQLLKRETDEGLRFNTLLQAIQQSSSLLGPLTYVSVEFDRENKPNRDESSDLISAAHLEELKSACIQKILDFHSQGKLLQHSQVVYSLYQMKRWSVPEDQLKQLLFELTSSDEGFLNFVSRFASKVKSQSAESLFVKEKRRFNYKNLSDFLNLEECKERLQKILKSESPENIKHIDTIKLFLENWDNRDNADF